MKIVKIERHEVTVELVDWHSDALLDYHGFSGIRRSVVVVHTDNGLEGLGEGGMRNVDVERYIGTSPFDWVGDDYSLVMGKAMYDLMGKALGIPAYKLFGQRVRPWVPMGYWTVSQPPEAMAEHVRRASEMGYTWIKYHTSPYQNIIEQTEAMQAVAPPGFKIHYDLNGGRTNDNTVRLVQELGRFPIAGAVEDPLDQSDLEGYRMLREKSPLPILIHGASFDHLRELEAGAADGYILGHSVIGVQLRRAQLFAAYRKPFMIQNSGGALTQSFLIQMTSTFPTATLTHYSDTNVWKTDVVKERWPIVGGQIRVPEAPGLGVTLDRDELERLKALPAPSHPPFIVRCRYANGRTLHFIHEPDKARNILNIPDLKIVPQTGYADPIKTEYWHDDGSEEYRAMFARCQRAPVWE